MQPIVTSNPDVMHGEPCFAGTRVAVRTFFDHLEAGYTVAGFLEQFPTVRREQVVGLLAELRLTTARSALREADGTPPIREEGLRRAYSILGERFASGQKDVAERHNEHQP